MTAVVVFGVTVVRRPQFWSFMFPEATDQQAVDSSEREPADAGAPLAFDEFLVRSGSQSLQPTGELQNQGDVRQTAYNNSISVSDPVELTVDPSSGIRRIPEALLRDVQDDVIGVHSTEATAYYAAVKLSGKLRSAELRKAPDGRFALFMDSPNACRGTVWRIQGQLRRLSKVKRLQDEFGIGTIYDAWISTPDSGGQLVHVVTTSVASQLPPRDSYGKDAPAVEFCGYFFKREGYTSKQGISLAPLFVAGRLNFIPPQVAVASRAKELTPYLSWLTIGVCCSVAGMLWWFSASDHASRNTRTHQLTKLPAHLTFDGIEAVPTEESLRRMGELQEPVESNKVE